MSKTINNTMSFDTISEDVLQDLFAYMNAKLMEASGKKTNDNTHNNNRYPIGNNLVFGEELATYVPIPGHNHYSIMESDPFYAVRVMAMNITREVYGEPRLVDMIVGVYKDLVTVRKSRGYHGVRGLSMKGVVTACLYLIILYDERTRLSIDVLVKAANRVNGQSKTKVTEKMITRYIQLIIGYLKAYQNDSNNNSNNTNNENNRTVMKHVDEEIKRIVIKLKYPLKDTRPIRALVRRFPRNVIVNHIPRTVAASGVFLYITRDRNSEKNALSNKTLLKDIGITKPVLEKLIYKIKNVSINVK